MESVSGQVVLPAHGRARAHVTRGYRHPINTLAYVRIDHGNGGIIRNLSEKGMGIQAVGRLHLEQIVHLKFEIIRPRARFDLVAQVAWADATGQAGLRFVDIAAKTQRLVRDWLFTDLLIAAMELSPAASPLLEGVSGDARPAAFRPIVLASTPAVLHEGAVAEPMPIRFSWWPADIRPRTLAFAVDGLILSAAVLLFLTITIKMTELVPAWPLLLTSAVAVGIAFGLVYRYLFNFAMGSTLGTRLAMMAAKDLDWMEVIEEQTPRFR